ncbi:MAG: long-chain fatty acid--CoA ligase [Alphaproteobacteria bacterium]|nr:long-chain fatty acid--CoA ligase [Alphaproteobacteria bacterium]
MQSDDFPWIKSYDDGVDWHMEIPLRPVFSMLNERVERYGQRPAFDFLGKKYNWTQIGDLVSRFAAGLQALGIGKDHRVGLFLPNCPYFLIAYYGVLSTGATVVNFNPLYAPEELSHQIKDSRTEIMVTADLAVLQTKLGSLKAGSGLKKMIICRFRDALPFPKNLLFSLFKPGETVRIPDSDSVIWFHELIRNPGKPLPPAIDPVEDVAVLQYTGGTTGTPKGAMLTHANVTANALQSLSWLKDAHPGAQKMLGVLPFFHVFAMTAVMNLSVLAGLEIIALPRFDLKDVLRAIHKKKPDFFPAVPAIYNAINNFKGLERYDLSSLKYCISGGAPLPVEVKKSFENLTSCVVVEGYGLSESSPVACINPLKGKNIPGSIGLPVPGTLVEIIDPEDKTTPVQRGARGELCIRGPQVMKGYWEKPEETAAVLRPVEDGSMRLYTGDIAVMDDDGYVFIVDRLKDMIITNGYKVYPRNVEEAIYRHPDVEECIVAGLPDQERGEIVKAWVRPKQGRTLNPDDLKSFLADKISKTEMPRTLEFRTDPLPKTAIGKLSRKDVIAQEKAGK